MSASSTSVSLSAILAAATGATDTGANSVEGGIEAAVDTSATAKVSTVIATTAAVNNAAVTTATDSSSSDSSTSTDSSTASAKVASTTSSSSSSTATTAETTSTSTTSSSSSTSDKGTSTSASTTSASSQTSSASTSATSGSSSASKSTTITSAAQSTATADPKALATSASLQLTSFTTTAANGQPTTVYTSVYASATATAERSTTTSPAGAFFQNKAAVGGVFGAVGLISLILLLAIVLKIVRYRSNRKFERELNEQVDNEVRSGTPIFGFGKEDDGMSVRGIGMGAGGMLDPEKAYAGVGSYANGNTAAYAAYGDRAPQAALQQAYYSPNAPGGAPRRYPSQGHSRTGSLGSNRSYGSLGGTPMNAFAPATFAAPPGTYANSNPNYNNYNYGEYRPATASPVAPANYGEYRGPSPAPSTQSYQSYGARPGTPNSLTPGGAGRASPVSGVALPRGVYDPRTPSPAGVIGSGIGIGVRPDLPVVPVGGPRRGSRDYVPSGLGRQPTQTLGLPASNLMRGNSVNSIKAPLPNPFDQRD